QSPRCAASDSAGCYQRAQPRGSLRRRCHNVAQEWPMPAVFQNFGVRFLYPENWSITDEDDEGWPCTVTVQSQETGFWSLHVYPPAHEFKSIVKELIAAIQAEFSDIEVLPAKETFGETATTGV